ncbi:MAG TPA: hypothetical protein VF331_16495 [Polyangiales bacterium]
MLRAALTAFALVSCARQTAATGSDAGPTSAGRGGAGTSGAAGGGGAGYGSADAGVVTRDGGPAPTDAAAPNAHGPYAYYYPNPTNFGQVYGVPRSTTNSVLLASGKDPHNIVNPFTFDAEHVYYGDNQTALIALATSGKATATTLVSGLHRVTAIAVDATDLYFLDVEDPPSGAPATAASTVVGRVALAGTVEADAGAFQELVRVSGGGATSLALYDGHVYWAADSAGTIGGVIRRVSTSGGAAETLASQQVSPRKIAVDASGVYWLNLGHLGVDCSPTDGSLVYLAPGTTATRVLVPNLAGASALTVKDGTVYFTTAGAHCNVQPAGGGNVWKLVSPSATPQSLVGNVTEPDNLFVDATDVYFTVVTDTFNYIEAAAKVVR